MMVRFVYRTRKADDVRKVQERLGVTGMTVNREWTVEADERMMEVVRELEKEGFIGVREVRNK